MSKFPFNFDEQGNPVINAVAIRDARIGKLRISEVSAMVRHASAQEIQVDTVDAVIDDEQKARARRDSALASDIEGLRREVGERHCSLESRIDELCIRVDQLAGKKPGR